MANSSSGESMLQRLVKLLSVFDDDNPPQSVADLARRADLPKSTAHRLIAEMIDERILTRTEDGELRLGIRLWELANRASSVTALREAALPYMDDVFAVVQQHTTLGVLDAGEMLYIERLGAHSSAVSIAKIAKRLPLHACSSGMVLLAYSPPSVQNELLARPAQRFTRDTVTDADELRIQLAEIRRHGYSVMAGAIVPESTGIAVPVFGAHNQVVAALNVIVPTGEADPVAHVPVLRTAALAISRELGWQRVPAGRRPPTMLRAGTSVRSHPVAPSGTGAQR